MAPHPDGETARRAQQAFASGVELARAERWFEAAQKFQRSFELVPRASAAFNLALALYRLGRLHEVTAAVERYLELAPESARERAAALELRRKAVAGYAKVEVHVEPPDARVVLNGSPVAADSELSVDPGTHVLEVTAEGHRDERLTFQLEAAERSTVRLSLEPASRRRHGHPAPSSATTPTASDSRREHQTSSSATLPWVLAGLGGASLAAGTVTGIMSLNLDADLDARCPEGLCSDARAEQDQERLDRLTTTTDILLVAGGTLVLTGVGWALLSSGGEPAGELNARLGPGIVHVEGRF